MKRLDWRQPRVALALAVVLTTAGAIAVGFWPRHPDPPIVQIQPSERDEVSSFGTIKYVYALDGTTIAEKHIPYADGSLGHQFYREDGTLRETTEHYPQRDGAAAVLKARANWSRDGKRLESGEVFRPDGSLWLAVKEIDDSSREESFYFADGWKFFSRVKRQSESSQVMRYFHRNGNLWAEVRMAVTQWASTEDKTTMVFDASGKRKLFEIHNLNYGEQANGFNPGESGRLVTYFDENGKPTHRQWGNTWWNSYLQMQGQLKLVHILGYAGSVDKTIEVDDSGQMLRIKSVKEASGATRVFRDFGLNTRKIALEKFLVQGQPKERFLLMGTIAYEIDKQGTRTDYDDNEKKFETVDLTCLTRPDDASLQERRTAAQAEDRSILGARDDSDPVKWYHK